VYVSYRANEGGKTQKDLRAVRRVAELMRLPEPIVVRSPLGRRPKSWRNRHIIDALGAEAFARGQPYVALGTYRPPRSQLTRLSRATRNDLNPALLKRYGRRQWHVSVITLDDFGVRDKWVAFRDISGDADRKALFATTSCQLWFKKECGRCYSCRARHEAFTAVFGHDPTVYSRSPAF
jgi:hypothetical protein